MERSQSIARGIGKQVANVTIRHQAGIYSEGLKMNACQFPLPSGRNPTCQAIRVFRPKIGGREELEAGEYCFSRIVDEFSMLAKSTIFRVCTVRKKKADKVRPVDLGVSDSSKPGGVLNWVEKSKKTDVVCDKKGMYSDW